MKKRRLCIMLLAVFLTSCLPIPAVHAADTATLSASDTEIQHTITSVGQYANWSGVSDATQFADENGDFCFALDGQTDITIVKTKHGVITEQFSIAKEHPLFGTALCDRQGYLYVFWGQPNTGDDTSVQTVFLSKYSASGELLSTVGGDGSEGLADYYSSDFYTRIPFDGGNCDAAISGDTLLVNYAREMYSGHQSNGIFAVNLTTMQPDLRFKFYESHSFNQCVSPYSKTGGFLLTSHGDCYERAFTTAVTDADSVCNVFESFHFWVYDGAYTAWDMLALNCTYAYLGNILETSRGAMLVASSAKSMSEAAAGEPQNLFVQVFDPTASATEETSYVTAGTRSGLSGPNGDQATTDYGVQWLTELAAPYSIGFSQAVCVDADTVVVLYEQNQYNRYHSTWYTVLNAAGQVLVSPTRLDGVRLNKDEDPVFADGAVQWVANDPVHNNALRIYGFCPAGLSCDWITRYDNGHRYTAQIIAPTCTEAGYTMHTCSCGDSYMDTDTDALGHDMIDDAAVAPTCIQAGLTAGRHCSRCDAVTIPQINIPALGHDMVIDAAAAATCTEAGLTEGSHCSRCDAVTTPQTVVSALGHDIVIDAAAAPTCTEAGLTEGSHCSRCDAATVPQEVLDALGHIWDDGRVSVKPLSTVAGVKTFTCTRCGETKLETIPATGEWENPFADVSAEAWYYNAVEFAVINELFQGTSSSTFSPNGNMTRAMLVTVLWRLAGKPDFTGNPPFTDVPDGKWYTQPIIWAAANEIVSGIGNGRFDPNGNVTREQMAAILYRYAGKMGYDIGSTGSLSAFNDTGRISAYALPAMKWAVAEGIINGVGGGAISPKGNAERAQVAAIFQRFVTTFAR